MATSVTKKSKKISYFTIFSLVSALIPQILEAVNKGQETVHLVISNNKAVNSLDASVLSISSDGVVDFATENPSISRQPAR
jgi:hypothetical protein